MATRSLRIEKFRSIGIDEPATLVLNHSMEEGEQGNLIILVGENNSGKSNVLDALMCFRQKSIENRDKTLLEYGEEYQKPVLSLVTSDGKQEYACILKYGSSSFEVCASPSRKQTPPLTKEEAIRVYSYMECYLSVPSKIKETLQNEKSSKQEIELAIKGVIDRAKNCYAQKNSHPYYNIIENIRQNLPTFYSTLSQNQFESVNTEYIERFGASILPAIIRYEEKKITNNDIVCTPDNINTFMINLLEDIGYKVEDLKRAYSIANSLNDSSFLKKLEDQLNQKIGVVSKKFNSLYQFGNDYYKFAFRAESTKLSLIISKNDQPLTLNYQSTGFRWFFNLYFNFLSKNSLKAGDIVIMDEPATHLHVRGQQELRKFLKDFTLKTGINIVLATHSPFLIDMNHLDELRVVKNINGRTFIENDFAAINPNDSDTLSSVIDALTVQTHILCDPDKQLVFVEGITDYNAYIKFASMLDEKYQNLCFLPVNGIGKTQEQQRAILKRIMEIGRKRDFILLVDGDKAGKAIKKLNGENDDLPIISLDEIDPTFTEIESLFADADLVQLGIKRGDGSLVKSSALSSNIKNYRSSQDFSDETTANFKKVLDRIVETFEED